MVRRGGGRGWRRGEVRGRGKGEKGELKIENLYMHMVICPCLLMCYSIRMHPSSHTVPTTSPGGPFLPSFPTSP